MENCFALPRSASLELSASTIIIQGWVMKRGLLLVLSMLAIVGCEVKTPDVVPPNGATPF